jgi:hypothetical protein
LSFDTGVHEQAFMRRSLANPRILLPVLLAAALLWSVVWAYLERPRVHVGLGGIGDTIPVRQSDFKKVKLRSVQFYDELENRLKSAEFAGALRASDVRQPPLFGQGVPVVVRRAAPPGLDVMPRMEQMLGMVSDAYQGRKLVFLVGDSWESDIYVMYLFPQSYSVYQPGNPWILWLQAHLPGMADTAKLAAEAEAANQAAKEDLRKLVQATVEDFAASQR